MSPTESAPPERGGGLAAAGKIKKVRGQGPEPSNAATGEGEGSTPTKAGKRSATSDFKISLKLRDAKAPDPDLKYDVEVTNKYGEKEIKSLGEWRKSLTAGDDKLAASKDKLLLGLILQEVTRREGTRKKAEAAVSKPQSIPATGDDEDEKEPKKPDLATIMVNMMMQGGRATLFHTPIGNPFIRIWRKDHNEVRSLDDSFENFISNEFRKRTGKAAPPNSVKCALANLAAAAIEDGEVHDLRIRVAHRQTDKGLEVWYDLCDPRWRAVRITKDGWEIVADPPILFYRTDYTYEQVEPAKGVPGALKTLIDSLINVTEWQKPMVGIQLITDLLAIKEQIISVDKGGHGSGKSSKDKAETGLIDPHGCEEANVFQNPERDEELELLCIQTYIAAIDNVSNVKPARSDLFCTIGTRGMRNKRKHYKNRQMDKDTYRCALRLNGISNPLTRADALDRTIEYVFDQRPKKYMKASDWWAAFYLALPFALADLFDHVSKALKKHQENSWTGDTPRMGEWYSWAIAAAESMEMKQEEFIELFKRFDENRKQQTQDQEPLAKILMDIADKERPFIGTMTDLLGLDEARHDRDGKSVAPRRVHLMVEKLGYDWRDKTWPKKPSALGQRIDRVSSVLDDCGYESPRDKARYLKVRFPELASRIDTYLISIDKDDDERLIILRKKPVPATDSDGSATGSKGVCLEKNEGASVHGGDAATDRRTKAQNFERINEHIKRGLNAEDVRQTCPELGKDIERLRRDGRIGVRDGGKFYWADGTAEVLERVDCKVFRAKEFDSYTPEERAIIKTLEMDGIIGVDQKTGLYVRRK